MQSRMTLRTIIGVLAGLCLACTLVGALAVMLRPRTFSSRVEAIGYVLRQRGITYQEIYIDHTWPDTVNTISYGANLVVIVGDQGKIGGRIDCKTMNDGCRIALPKLGVDWTAIPDLTIPHDMPLLTWLEAQWVAVQAGKLPWE